MRLTKHHGLGNDFLVALSADQPAPLDPDPALAVRWCDRRRGIGADGLIWGLPARNPSSAELRMILHNSDGSEAEISGNGIRCLAQAVLRLDGRADGALRVETGAGLRDLEVSATAEPHTVQVRVDMGAVTPGPAVPPQVVEWGALHVVSLDIGNPHLVLHVDGLDRLDPARDGAAIAASVPGGINVHFLVAEGPDRLRLAHWERGAGVTEACGSGASVAAVAAHDWGLTGDRVTVVMPGGEAHVEVGEHVHLTGPATYVADVVTP
ncbi:MAG TPA: diaminopimelate epimerase [Microthrixaceae bacterium]|nr:diaminopimelate epimerase [Microthrixaceae bacterium]